MPIYEYRCDNGHTFEVTQRMSDDPLVTCQTCDAPVQRVFHPVAVHFKGSGFYNTDYGTRKRARETAESEKSTAGDSAKPKDGDSAKSSGGDGAKPSGGEKKTESKTASASE